jgi:hypothetical protein
MMADHSQEECVLHPNRALPMVQMQDAGRPRVQDIRRVKREQIWPCHACRCRYDHVCSYCGGDLRDLELMSAVERPGPSRVAGPSQHPSGAGRVAASNC